MTWECKYRIGHYDLGGVQCQIDIEEQGYSGAITELLGSGDPCDIEYDNNADDIFDPIHASRITLKVIAQSNFQLADLYSNEDMQFRVKFYRNYESAGSDVYWMGYIVPGRISEPYEPHPYPVTIECECGLNSLGNIRYFNESESTGSYYNGRVKESQIILDILNKIGHTEFTEYVNLYEDRMNKTTDDSPMDQLLIDVDLFKDMYCDEVLAHLLVKYNAVITMKDGVFVIDRPLERILPTCYGRIFTGVTTHTSTNFTPLQYISRRTTHLSNFLQVPGGVNMTQPPASKITLKQDYGYKKSWIDNWEFKGETWDTMFEFWLKSGLPIPALLSGFVPGEKDGVMLAGHNTYPTVTNYIYQEFGSYGLASASDPIAFEIDYMFHNIHTAPVSGIRIYIRIECASGKHLRNGFSDDDPGVLDWLLDEVLENKYITIVPGDILPGDSDWNTFKGVVSSKYAGAYGGTGLPESGPYTIKIFCTDDSGDRALVYPAFKNVRFYTYSTSISVKPVETKGKKVKWWTIGLGSYGINNMWKETSRWDTQSVQEFKECVMNTIEVFNDINGKELQYGSILGDVTDSDVNNVIEQFSGALAMSVSQSLEQAAGAFVAAFADDYLTGGVILSFEEDSLGVVDIVFTSETAGTPFTGDSSITNTSGDISGTLPAGKQTANAVPVGRMDSVVLDSTATGGTANITCEGLTKLATFDTNPIITATNFVNDWAAAYLAIGIVLTNDGSRELYFEALDPAVDFTVNDTGIVNVSGDLNGTPIAPYTAQSGVYVAQIATIQLSGSSGAANILCDGVTKAIAITTVTGHTLAWSSFGDSESLPLLELIANEIAKQYSRAKKFIQMPIQEIGNSPSAFNIIGNFQDDLNKFGGVNRKFVFNRGSYKTRFRRWVADLVEIIL